LNNKEVYIKNTTVYTNLNIIEIYHGTAKPISRQILLCLKQRKENLISSHSIVLTAKMIIKWIVSTVHSENTDLIVIGTTSCRSFKKSKLI